MGKPRKPREKQGDDTVWVSFRIPQQYSKQIDEIAAREDRSRASVVRRLIIQAFTLEPQKEKIA